MGSVFARTGRGVAILLAAAACSSGGRSDPATPAPVVVVDDREAILSAALGRHVAVNDPPATDSFPAPLATTHRALVAAYTGLGIPANIVDAETGLVAVTESRVRGELAGSRASRFLSCGRTVTGERADEDRVTLTVISRLTPSGTSASRVETRVVATAIDTRGTSARQGCTSTGELEARLHRAAKQALGT
jgi:hypothetical protein